MKNDAIRLGAADVLIRPFADEQLEAAIYRYLGHAKNTTTGGVAGRDAEPVNEDGSFVAASPLMQKFRAQVELLAQADVPVLILGERGSGRETAARLIHRLSVRSGYRFLKINCSALPQDLLEKEVFGAESVGTDSLHQTPVKREIAGKGMILLEEIAAMPLPLQARLLAVLESRRSTQSNNDTMSDVRILASTSASIEHVLAERKLREELYYLLSAFTLHVPPLRQRKEEMGLLLQHFMHNLAKHYGLPEREFSAPVIEACENYSWPGNVRELEAFVKRYLVAGDSDAVLNDLGSGARENLQELSDAPEDYLSAQSDGNLRVSPPSLKSLMQSIKCETERNAIGLALEKTDWNRKGAARLLGVSYRALLYKIDQYQIDTKESFASPLSAMQSSPVGSGTKGKAS